MSPLALPLAFGVPSESGLFEVLAAVLSFALTILWVVIAWRAMRAHETLADHHQDLRQEVRRLANALDNLSEKNPAGKTGISIAGIDPSKLPRFKD
jgi:hypothetical protein